MGPRSPPRQPPKKTERSRGAPPGTCSQPGARVQTLPVCPAGRAPDHSAPSLPTSLLGHRKTPGKTRRISPKTTLPRDSLLTQTSRGEGGPCLGIPRPPRRTGPRGSPRVAPAPPAAAARAEESSGRVEEPRPTEAASSARKRSGHARASKSQCPPPPGTRAAPAARVLPGRRPGKRLQAAPGARGGGAPSPAPQSGPGPRAVPGVSLPLSRPEHGPCRPHQPGARGREAQRASPLPVRSGRALRCFRCCGAESPASGRVGPASGPGSGRADARLGRSPSKIHPGRRPRSEVSHRPSRAAHPTFRAELVESFGAGAGGSGLCKSDRKPQRRECVCLGEPERCPLGAVGHPGHPPSRPPRRGAPAPAPAPASATPRPHRPSWPGSEKGAAAGG